MNKLSRGKKLFFTTSSSIALQIVTIITGFILPRLYLIFWGSEVNGLVSSISQFLSLISFLDLGVGQVVQSSLYKPLADKDFVCISEVLVSSKRFFQNLAKLFLVYTIGVALFYPIMVKSEFGYLYIMSLVLILAINSFAQYYFGVTFQILLNSDQRGYVQNSIQLITLILNVIACVILLYAGGGLHVVKLITAGIFLLRPFFMYLYFKKNYPDISFRVKLKEDPIKQKWDGFAQHLASVVLNNTDVVVLTLFSTLTNVSIYAVYNLVISGVKQLVTSTMSGVQAVLGELWAKREIEELKSFFQNIEWIIHTITVLIFGCTGSLIVPFVSVYTKGVSDANYVVPMFGYLLTLAHACHCIRLPYNSMVLVAGHFRQTQFCYISSALINIVVSIAMVWRFGLVGVAVGTLVSMVYQTLWLVVYLHKHLFNIEVLAFVKQILIDIATIVMGCLVASIFIMTKATYVNWFLLAIKVGLAWLAISVILNFLFYRAHLVTVVKKLLHK